MAPFNGFQAGSLNPTPVPGPFFTELLPEIDSLAELKVCLYAIWFLDRQESPVRFVRRSDFTADRRFMKGLGATGEAAQAALADGLERACGRGILLFTQSYNGPEGDTVYFLNTPRGRAALQAYQRGEWDPNDAPHVPVALDLERPNVFRLYEENIGPLTPMIADMLRDAEREYPLVWIEDAIRSAVQNNARSWRYVEKILSSWKGRGGRDASYRRDSEKDRRGYDQSRFEEFIER